MKTNILTLASVLAFVSASAQTVESGDSRWLQRNPASPQRAEKLLEIERKQILETGTYNLSPFMEPSLEQVTPSQKHLLYFYNGQRELFEYNQQTEKQKSDLKAIRAQYEMLYNEGNPEYQSEAEYYLGYIDYLEGDYDSALRHFNRLPLDAKYNATVPFYLMQISFIKGNFDEALNACNNLKMRSLTPEQQTEVTRIKAESLLEKGKRAEALAAFREYQNAGVEMLPTSAYNAAVLEYEDHQYDRAAQLARYATQSQMHLLRQYAYMLVGQADLQLGQTEQARLAFEQAAKMIADKSVSEAAAYNLCAIVHESNQTVWGNEIHILEDFINNYPNSRYNDQVSGFLSEAYTTTKNYDAALASINKIQKPNSELLKAKQRLLYQLGIQQYVNSNYKQANQRFTQCIELGNLNPKWRAVAYFWRGECRYHQADYAGAVSDYKSFTSLRPEGVQPGIEAASYYNQGYAYLKQQNYADALEAFSQYIDKYNEQGTATYTDGLTRLADCYYYTRQFATAEEYYHNVATEGANQADYALYQEALMMGLQKKYTQKQSVLENLISQYPSSDFIDDAWLDKGRTALLTTDNSEAIRCFTQVVDNYPESPIAPQAAVQLAMTYNNMGRADDAQRIYQLVEERYPGTDAAISAAEDLKTLSIQQRIASLPALFTEGKYQELLDNYQQLTQQNVDFRDRQNLQLLCGKSHLALDQQAEATSYLTDASQDLRTAAGAEAKFTLAQMAFDGNDTPQSQQLVSELLQSGTPHQYWLARGIILMSDIYRQQGENFTASEYLKSLQQNYTVEDDIQSLVNSRLNSLENEN